MFLGQEVNYYMVYIAYLTELDLQICNYAQKRHIYREIVNTRLTKFVWPIGHFCPRRKAANFCHPESGQSHRPHEDPQRGLEAERSARC